MFPLFKKLIKGEETEDTQKDKFFCNIRHISNLTDEIEKKKKKIDDVDYEMLIGSKDDVYISLSDFLELIDEPLISIEKVLSKFRHVYELNGVYKDVADKVSVVEIYSVAEGSHIVLCKDPATCDAHKHYAGNKLRIITARRIRELK